MFAKCASLVCFSMYRTFGCVSKATFYTPLNPLSEAVQETLELLYTVLFPHFSCSPCPSLALNMVQQFPIFQADRSNPIPLTLFLYTFPLTTKSYYYLCFKYACQDRLNLEVHNPLSIFIIIFLICCDFFGLDSYGLIGSILSLFCYFYQV